MFKRQLCLGLCVFIVFSMVSIMLVQAADANSGLSASYVKFSATQGGDALTNFPFPGNFVYASVEVTNSGTEAKPAVFWVGVYQNDVLVDVEYQYQSVPAATTIPFAAPAIEIKEGYSNDTTEIIAYVWNSFSKANPIVTSANMHRDSGDLKNIYIDGVPLSGFNNEVLEYVHKASIVNGYPAITAVATDNATKVEVSDFTIPGNATVTVTKSNSDTKIFNITMKIKGNITNLTKSKGVKTTPLETDEELIPVTSYSYTDRTNYPLTYISADLVGEALIRMPLGDVRCGAADTNHITYMTGDNVYYTFVPDTDCVVYAISNTALNNYTNPANGWTTVNSGTSFFPILYNNKNYTDYNKIDGNTTTDILPKDYNPTKATGLAREQTGAVTWYRYVYKKSFSAGETVSIPTVNTAAVSPPAYPEGAVWVVKWGADN